VIPEGLRRIEILGAFGQPDFEVSDMQGIHGFPPNTVHRLEQQLEPFMI
jgi:hypothetical protein